MMEWHKKVLVWLHLNMTRKVRLTWIYKTQGKTSMRSGRYEGVNESTYEYKPSNRTLNPGESAGIVVSARVGVLTLGIWGCSKNNSSSEVQKFAGGAKSRSLKRLYSLSTWKLYSAVLATMSGPVPTLALNKHANHQLLDCPHWLVIPRILDTPTNEHGYQ